LSLDVHDLEEKLAELLAWERRKRWEEVFVSAFCTALTLAVVIAPLHVLLPEGELRWLIPVVLLAVLAPIFYYRQRWARQDAARAVVRLDKSLGLDERAVTAWELSGRDEAGGPAQLVFKQAQERLRQVDMRRLFPRRWRWPAYLALPLFVLWFTCLWLDFDRWTFDNQVSLRPQTLVYRARQYARQLQEKAKSEGLRETLKLGQEIEKAAQKSIENKSADDSFKNDLAGVTKKFNEQAKAGAGQDSLASATGQQSLKDLKTELEAARDFTQLEDFPKGSEQGRQWMERLAAMPQLKRQFEQAERAGQGPGQGQLRSFLDKLDQQVSGELDRRALIDAQQYLQQMMQKRDGEQKENYAHSSGQGEEESSTDSAKEKNHNNLPGKEPGKKVDEARGLPEFRADASTQIKGALGAGGSSVLFFKGKPTPGKTSVAQEEVVASYQRQAEQELNSERVPAALKETIKNYFMSLGENGTKNERGQ
jgi:hypothetical protein